jgi:DNA-binding FadR family transcriptional regulator
MQNNLLSHTVNRVVQEFRREALNAVPGTFLGSTAELVERFKVSRPTFRQAAKVLEQEQLLTVRTGIGGGYFVRQPDTAAVAHMTDVYLQSRDVTVEQVLTIFSTLYVLVARTAAMWREKNGSPIKLREFAQQEGQAVGVQIDWPTHVSNQSQMIDILADLSGNPLMKLFFTITREMMTPYYLERMVPPGSEEIAHARTTRIKLMVAILDGEPDFAEVVARRYMEQVERWLLAEQAQRRIAAPPATKD